MVAEFHWGGKSGRKGIKYGDLHQWNKYWSQASKYVLILQ